ncbi:PAS domain S-box protein [Aurantimonas sp. MSK8Z-1]|uniref:PAS domain-containing sensor histidine kinase n=1 Tax=Mangrovibrevibacter kandeliae TaxID=2968473 RepID=UPI002117338A|nr:PAS domain-containing sensor histidine kinase [Aurantimonas sp. MSK8Z-1]MCW4114082.1 PAS domain S-box protein [Aurantimonas sp. MSK8Z-1]
MSIAQPFEMSWTEEERYRLLVHAITDYAIYMLDTDGVVTTWNPGAQRLKGYRTRDIVGRNFSQFYSEEDRLRGEPQRALATAAREGRFESEGWRYRKSGERFWANGVIDPIRDERGTLIGFAKVTRDMTERREAQLALERAREALFQAQKMEAVGQLSGGIAHDFNNLLMAISGSLELLGKRLPPDPRYATLLDNARKGTERGAALTKRMLAFAEQQPVEPRSLDLQKMVEGMASLLQRSLGPMISISLDLPAGLDFVHADLNQLELALLNLAVNARDSMIEGGVLHIAARQVEHASTDLGRTLPPGRYIRLVVRETGASPATSQPPLLTSGPFFAGKGAGQPSGIGLSMIHGIAEQAGGRLFLDSRQGQGTTAELWLPAVPRVAAASEGLRLVPDPAARGAQPLTVLAVDDDSLVLTNTAAMLEDLGHRAIEATSGVEALAVLQRETAVDLVITDYAMPRMTGLQLATTISARWPNLPIIIATGYAEFGSGGANMHPVLSKPFLQRELADAISNAIESV